MNINPISDELEQLIIASILGDGSIRYVNKGSRANARIEFAHAERQGDYLWWKYNIFKKYDLVNSKPRHIMSGNDKQYPQLRFETKTNKLFNNYHYMFYKTKERKLTRKILNKLTPLGLAIWYMDDGNLSLPKYTKKDGSTGIHCRRLMLNTQGFSYEENVLIQRYFKVVWSIDVNINKNNGYHRIVMGAKSANLLINIIKPYIIPSLEYKIDMKYKNKLN